MKKIILLIAPVVLLLVSCSKQEIVRPPVDESYWLRQERGLVVASDFSCDYFVVETPRGYSVLRNWGGSSPFPGSVIYGNLSNYGASQYYNRSEGYIFEADVREYWLSYYTAMDEAEWYCGGSYFRKADSTVTSDSTKTKNGR
jgi:hypothetical protein